MEDPYARATIQSIIILKHQRWVQAVLSDSLATLATNAMLIWRNLTINSLAD